MKEEMIAMNLMRWYTTETREIIKVILIEKMYAMIKIEREIIKHVDTKKS